MKATPKRIDARKAAMERAQQARRNSKELQAVYDFVTNSRWFPVDGFKFVGSRGAKFETDEYGNRVRV